VDPRLGTFGDFVEVVRTARDRGMRVIIDLVLNHTSDKHPWFRSARRSESSPYRDWYIWRSQQPPDTSDQVVFPDKEDSLWQYDEAAGEWYFHRFYRTQPDLNITTASVRDEMVKIIGFWLELGISGFRVDAVPFMIDPEGVDAETRRQFGSPHDHLREIRGFLERRVGVAALLGEVNLPYPEQRKFFGGDDADELTMQFDFIAMQNLYLSLAREDARRDPRRLRLVYSLLFSLPGTPVLFYGEEIGMGENLDIPGRLAVRTPMQWSDARNGGFSDAAPSRMRRPLTQGPFGPEHVNVASQRTDPQSLLGFIKLLIRRYRESPELGWSEFRLLDQPRREVLVHLCARDERRLVAVHNLAGEGIATTFTVPDCPDGTTLVDLLDQGWSTPVGRRGRVDLTLDAYGYRWLRVDSPGNRRLP
jgi:glycosidase